MGVNLSIKKRIVSKEGFTLIELLVVIVIIGILAAIAVPVTNSLIEKSRSDVCNANMLHIERSYKAYIDLNGIERPDIMFATYLKNYWGTEDHCPLNGDISYQTNGQVKCDLHPRNNDIGDMDDEEDSGGVPFF